MHEAFMKRCIELALNGAGEVAPNPMVGCVIVHDGKIIGEGFHKKFGEAHAEVNAINSISDTSLFKRSSLYVNLEPCSHFGKTPPCVDLIIEKEIPEVIVGCLDPNTLVAGRGIRKLEKSNVRVQVGVLDSESREVNERFITFHERKRPYIILKWAQSSDGFIAPKNGQRTNISNEYSRTLSHRWRSEEAAIMVGTTTAINDNPKLDVRLWNGKNPLRVVIDQQLRISSTSNIFDHSIPTLVFTEKQKAHEENLEFHKTAFSERLLQDVMSVLHEKQILSLIVEGGSQLHQSFIEQNLWDEARIFTASNFLGDGIRAAKINGEKILEENIFGDKLVILKNKS